MTRRARVITLIACATALLAGSTPVFAQGVILILREQNEVVELSEMSLSATGLGAPRVLGQWHGREAGSVQVSRDGQFVVWFMTQPPLSRLQELFVFDRATGHGQAFPGIARGGGGVHVDPSRSRVFISVPFGRLVVAEPGVVRSLDLGSGWNLDKVSADGRALFTHRCDHTSIPWSRVCTFAKRDSTTGAILHQFPLPAGTDQVVVAPSESELFVTTIEYGTYPLRTSVRRIDATGAETGSIPVPSPLGGARLIVHDSGQRFTVALSDSQPPFPGTLWTVDALASIWTEVARVPTISSPQLVAAAGAPVIAATSHPFRLLDPQRTCDAGTLDLVAPQTGTVVGSLALPPGGCVRTALAWMHVDPPSDLVASVDRNVVSLSWQSSASPGAHAVLEVGSAPGLSNLARFVLPVGQSSLVVPRVPPGTYFGRVRMVGGNGTSDPSNEIVVTVP